MGVFSKAHTVSIGAAMHVAHTCNALCKLWLNQGATLPIINVIKVNMIKLSMILLASRLSLT